MNKWLLLSFLLQSNLVAADALSDRLASFSIVNESSGSFVETWSADYLDEPLISQGVLVYKRPSQLHKFITSPERIEQHIDGRQLTVIHDGETRSIPLSEQPELAAGIYALQAILDGSEKNLHQFFEAKYSELNSRWTLSLTPTDPQVRDSITLIELQGIENRIQRMSVQFNNGDMLLTDIAHDD